MPLDFCHPKAPHKKLRLPEWYVSALMMDRALDAVVRRVKHLDRETDLTTPMDGASPSPSTAEGWPPEASLAFVKTSFILPIPFPAHPSYALRRGVRPGRSTNAAGFLS